MPSTTTTSQTNLDEFAKKRREILARCYQIILSSDWGVTGGQFAFASEARQVQVTYQETAETGVSHDTHTN